MTACAGYELAKLTVWGLVCALMRRLLAQYAPVCHGDYMTHRSVIEHEQLNTSYSDYTGCSSWSEAEAWAKRSSDSRREMGGKRSTQDTS